MKGVSFMKRLLSAVLIVSSICFVGCGEEPDIQETDSVETEISKNDEGISEKETEESQIEILTKDSDERTLSTFVDAFSTKGVSIDINEKPMFSMIGAIDGVIFYMDNHPIKIYEYESENKLEEEIENNTMLTQFERNGKFLLESSFDEAKEIFKNVK